MGINITRTISLVRGGNIKHSLKLWFEKKVERTLASVFRWALSHRAVQHEIVHAFTSRHTPMCDALQNAIGNVVEHQLGAAVSDEMDRYMQNYELDADDVKGLDRMIEHAVEEALKNEDAMEEITNEVVTQLIDKLRS